MPIQAFPSWWVSGIFIIAIACDAGMKMYFFWVNS